MVIVAAGVLAGTVSVFVGGSRQQTRDGQRVADVHAIERALQTYHARTGVYPNTLALLAPVYMSAVPLDPAGGGYAYNTYAPNLRACKLGGLGYHLGAALEDSATLVGEANAPAVPNGAVVCPGGTRPEGFSGVSRACTPTALPGEKNTCYDRVSDGY